MFTATFILSTGRCGTQWLAEKIRASYGDELQVEHEPIHNGYEPRRMLSAASPHALGPEGAKRILGHVGAIERRLETGDYLECGHPSWSSLPYLADRFSDRVRIVHLIRHPVPTAMSWATHSAFAPPLLPHLKEKVLLSPFDKGVAFPEYGARWSSLSAFEKCLYYWSEVNAFGLRLEGSLRVPWLRVSFEQIFSGPDLPRLLEFLGLGPRQAILDARSAVVDQHRFSSGFPLPERDVFAQHLVLADVAGRLGYDPAAVDREALNLRYTGNKWGA